MSETLLNGLLIACLGAFLGSVSYCIRKIWNHDTDLAHVKAEIAAMQKGCERHQKWQEDQSRTLVRVDKMLTKVAAKLDVEIEEGD